MGFCYANGIGVIQDVKEAVKLYQEAANEGDPIAQYNLACRYERGKGVTQDEKKAAELYQAAAKQGYADAQKRLSNYSGRENKVEAEQELDRELTSQLLPTSQSGQGSEQEPPNKVCSIM